MDNDNKAHVHAMTAARMPSMANHEACWSCKSSDFVVSVPAVACTELGELFVLFIAFVVSISF